MESIERVKKIRIILLVTACIACFVGASKSRAAEKMAATDVSKIKVQIVDKECYHKAAESEYRSGYYYVDLICVRQGRKITGNHHIRIWLNVWNVRFETQGGRYGDEVLQF